MSTRRELRFISTVLMIAVPLSMVAWDIYAAVASGGEATFSVILAVAIKKSPMIPFMIGFCSGVVVGHIFWPVRLPSKTK